MGLAACGLNGLPVLLVTMMVGQGKREMRRE